MPSQKNRERPIVQVERCTLLAAGHVIDMSQKH